MGHRIKHPTIDGAVYIAEVVISRLGYRAAQRCGLHDMLYEQLLCEEIIEFIYNLNDEESDKFIHIASALHPHLNEYTSDKTKEILIKIREDET